MTELAQMKVENILELFTPYLLAKDQPNEEKFITAQEYLENSEYNLALKIFQEICAQHPTSDAAHFGLALCELGIGDFQKAQRDVYQSTILSEFGSRQISVEVCKLLANEILQLANEQQLEVNDFMFFPSNGSTDLADVKEYWEQRYSISNTYLPSFIDSKSAFIDGIVDPDPRPIFLAAERDIRFDFNNVKDTHEITGDSMKENGFVVIDNYVPADQVQYIADKINDFYEPRRKIISNHENYEDDLFINDLFPKTLNDLDEIIACPKIVRTEPAPIGDLHLQFFNFHLAISEIEEIANRYMRSNFVIDTLNYASEKYYEAFESQVFISEHVDKTRYFHADNWGNIVKAFLYLTDVNSIEDGPYRYALGTHSNENIRGDNIKINDLLNVQPTEYSYFDKRRDYPVLGKKGTLILAFQRGAHRGSLQESGHHRLVLVNRFDAK